MDAKQLAAELNGIDYSAMIHFQDSERDFDAPRGAIVLWNSSIGGGAGHIAISLGGGKMVTTTGGAISIRNIRGFSDRAYLGWMPPYFRSRL